MKNNMKILPWVLLALYIALIISLLGLSYSGHLPYPLDGLQGRFFWTLFLLGITIVSQVLFIFTAGTTNLCTPIRPRRFVIPVMIASVMMAVLVAALFLSVFELVNADTGGGFIVLWIIFGFNWALWSIIFFIGYQNIERYKLLRNLVSVIIAGSLIELFVAILSHMIVSRRGCFAGMLTAGCINAGIIVMLWAFGPGIILLFLREKRKAELQRNAN